MLRHRLTHVASLCPSLLTSKWLVCKIILTTPRRPNTLARYRGLYSALLRLRRESVHKALLSSTTRVRNFSLESPLTTSTLKHQVTATPDSVQTFIKTSPARPNTAQQRVEEFYLPQCITTYRPLQTCKILQLTTPRHPRSL